MSVVDTFCNPEFIIFFCKTHRILQSHQRLWIKKHTSDVVLPICLLLHTLEIYRLLPWRKKFGKDLIRDFELCSLWPGDPVAY